MIKCEHCGHPNLEGAIVCEDCQMPLDDATIPRRPETPLVFKQPPAASRGTTFFGRRHRLVLYVVHADRLLNVDVRTGNGAVVGRSDPGSDAIPQVDLRALNGQQAGVSRKHARLVVQNDSLQLVDLGSTNGTFINGLRLPPYEPHALRDGDEIYLGRMKALVSFVESDA